MNRQIFPETQQYLGIVRTQYGETHFLERIKKVYVYAIKCRFIDIFSPHFGLILARLERTMVQHKTSFDQRYDNTATAHVAQILVEGFEPGSNFDYRNLESTPLWRQFVHNEEHEALANARRNVRLLNNIYIVSCSNNDYIIDALEIHNPEKSFERLTCD